MSFFSSTETIDSKFKAFHDANPQVYDRFCEIAFDAIVRGKTRMSSKFIFELMRWENHSVLASGFDNRFTSRYSRLFIAQFPRYASVFETRELLRA